MTTIGAVIVTWNSEEDIAACIAAAKKAGVAETIVVDNGSKDRTREIVAAIDGVKLLYFPENLGFAGGVNRGVAELSSDYALILNPDCLVQSGLDSMAEAAQDGAAGGRLLTASGELQSGFAIRRLPTPWTLIFEVLSLNRFFPRNRVNQRYRCADFDAARTQEIEQPPGAFFMVRKDIFRKLNGMDESYWPVWFEDVDFCLRLRKAGHKIVYCPAAKAKHRGGASIGKILWSFKELAWYGSLLRYSTQHFGWLSRRLVCLAVAAASVPRALTGIIYRRQGVRALGVYANVFCLAWVSLVLDRVDHRRFSRHAEGAEHL